MVLIMFRRKFYLELFCKRNTSLKVWAKTRTVVGLQCLAAKDTAVEE